MSRVQQGGQLDVGGRDETLEGGHRGRGGHYDQATAKLRQAGGNQRDTVTMPAPGSRG